MKILIKILLLIVLLQCIISSFPPLILAEKGNFSVGNIIETLIFLSGKSKNSAMIDLDENGKVELKDVIFGLQTIAGLNYYNTNPEIVLLIPTDIDKITIAWLPVATETSKIEDIIYEVHLSETDDFLPNASTLRTKIQGKMQTELQKLYAGTTYNALVVAIDIHGNKLSGTEYKEVTTLTEPIIMNDTPINNAENIGLGIPLVNQNLYIYSPKPGAKLPEIDSLLTGNNSNGEIYLRLVKTIHDNGSEVIIHTADASLSNVLSQGTLSTTIKMFDVNSVSQFMPISNNTKNLLNRRNKINGNICSSVFWENRLLQAEEIDFEHKDNNIYVGPRTKTGHFKISTGNIRSMGQAVHLNAGITFTPDLKTKVSWDLIKWYKKW